MIRSIWTMPGTLKGSAAEWETRLDFHASTHEPLSMAQKGEHRLPSGCYVLPDVAARIRRRHVIETLPRPKDQRPSDKTQ
jgi:hypothetical protein